MPTAAFSTETRRTLEDLRSLIAFRAASIRGRARTGVRVAFVVLVVLTALSAVVPAFVDGAAGNETVDRWRDLLPSFLLVFLALAATTSVVSGGGRELLSRENAVAFPVGPATDHLGALLMAPLNLAWILQTWSLLGLTAYVGGPGTLWSAIPLLVVWITLATALGQVAGWSLEFVRRRPGGTMIARVLLGAFGLLCGAVVAAGWGDEVSAPAELVVDQALSPGAGWLPCLLVLLALTAAVVVAGVIPARAALRRPAHEEHRLESSHYEPRPFDAPVDSGLADLRLMLRMDRASVLRSVALRRGLIFLTVLPVMGGIAYQLRWSDLPLFPGWVASSIMLLFAVNAWSLDGHGILWRESLPITPRRAIVARVGLMVQLTAVCATIAVIPAAVHAGVPTSTELVGLLCALVVGPTQVIGGAVRWSVARPYAVDLLSARAVPAPPMVMVGYSSRLALVTTLTGMTYSGLAQVDNALVPMLVLTVILLGWSGFRIWRTLRRWDRPVVRAKVVTAVAA